MRRAARSEELRAGSQVWQTVGPTSMTMLSWAMGPVAGRIVSLAVHPTDETIDYIGTASGGLWKTVDGGSIWTSLFDEVGTLSIGAVVLDPANPDVVWAGTGERQSTCSNYMGMGLFRSADGGATFEARNGDRAQRPRAVLREQHRRAPVEPRHAARRRRGLLPARRHPRRRRRLQDHRRRAELDPRPGGTGSDVIYDPGSPSVVYLAASGEGIFKSIERRRHLGAHAGDHGLDADAAGHGRQRPADAVLVRVERAALQDRERRRELDPDGQRRVRRPVHVQPDPRHRSHRSRRTS